MRLTKGKLKLADLGTRTISRIRKAQYDRVLEKHEGPWDWSFVLDLDGPEFLQADGYTFLLPVPRKHHRKITILRVIPSADDPTLTIFLKDATYEPDPRHHKFFAGRLAVCQKLKGEQFYLTTVYHEWFILDDPE
jgi:hypothetical protein